MSVFSTLEFGWEVHTHEEIIRIRVWSANSEELHQVMKLTVNISAYSDRAFLS